MSTWISFLAEGTVCVRSCCRSPPGLFEEEWGLGEEERHRSRGAESVATGEWTQAERVNRADQQGMRTEHHGRGGSHGAKSRSLSERLSSRAMVLSTFHFSRLFRGLFPRL